MEKREKKKFYEKMWFIVLMLIFVCPVGVFLLWKTKKLNKIVNIIITVIAIPYTLFGMLLWIGIFVAGDTTTQKSKIETVEKTEEVVDTSNNEVDNNEQSEELEQQKEVVKTEAEETSDKNSSDMLKGRTKVEDKESSYTVIDSVRLSSNSVSLLSYLLECNIDFDVYIDDRSTLVIFKYKGKDVMVNIDRQETFYYYDGKLLRDDDDMMKELFVEIFGVTAKQDYYIEKTAHATKSTIIGNNNVLVGVTTGEYNNIEAVLNSKTTASFYDNTLEDTVGKLLFKFGYKNYNIDLCSIQNLGDGEYYIAIAFGDFINGYELFGFNTFENKVYLSKYSSTIGVSINEDGLYAAKKLGYK